MKTQSTLSNLYLDSTRTKRWRFQHICYCIYDRPSSVENSPQFYLFLSNSPHRVLPFSNIGVTGLKCSQCDSSHTICNSAKCNSCWIFMSVNKESRMDDYKLFAENMFFCVQILGSIRSVKKRMRRKRKQKNHLTEYNLT